MLTPNGRFSINTKICVTNSGFHSDMWTPCWTIKQMLIGFYSIFIEDVDTGIAHIKETPAERKVKAANSCDFNMKNYKEIFMKFDQFVTPEMLKNNNIKVGIDNALFDIGASVGVGVGVGASVNASVNASANASVDAGANNDSVMNANSNDDKPKLSFKDRIKKKI